jgi:hypothetical protein
MNLSQISAFRALVALVPTNTPISSDIQKILNRLDSEIESLAKIDDPSTRDELKSATYYALLVNAAKTSLRTLIADAAEKLNSIIASFAAKLAADRNERGNLIPNGFAAEIRSVFRAMNWESQIQFMATATRARDGSTIAAILNFPPVLSGLNEEQISNFKESYLDAAAGTSSSILISKIQEVVDTALATAVKIAA